MIIVCGKVNFTNLSRYSNLSERTYRPQFDQYCNFPSLNAELIVTATTTHAAIAVMDCSFIAKSGQHTQGLDWFYNGSHSRVERGLEVALLAVVDVQTQTGYALSATQSAARSEFPELSRVDPAIDDLERHRHLLPPQVRYLSGNRLWRLTSSTNCAFKLNSCFAMPNSTRG